MTTTHIDDYTPATQKAIRDEAARNGVTVEAVIANADALFAGHRPTYWDRLFDGSGRSTANRV